MTYGTAGLFLAGAVFLVAGAELLVRGASRLATAAAISPLVVGLTVVAFGTSSPELAVTVGSTYAGRGEVALGNVVGSNIFNVLLILGLSALVAPLVVARRLVRLDVPLSIAASVAVLLLALDGRIGRVDGALLFAGIVAYIAYQIREGRRETTSPRTGRAGGCEGPGRRVGGWILDGGLVVMGLALLVLGARWLVGAAVDAASALGVSELVIGLTVVAAGTSLPEAATSVLATVRGERDIAVGNVVGSGIFNLLAVLGLASAVAPDGVPVPPGALTFDIPVMIAAAVATLPIFFTGHRIARWEGGVFLAYYVAYTVYLVLDATEHAALPAFGAALGWFFFPLTALTFAILAVRAYRGDDGFEEGGP